MLIIKINPVGIDKPVQNFQRFVYQQLLTKWSLQDSEFIAYGRCYRNKIDKGYIPEVFVSSDAANNTVYQQVEFDDTNNKALLFFDVDDDISHNKGTATAKVDLIFIVNVPGLKPELQHRGDEEIRLDAERICQLPRYNFTMKDTVTGFKNVFARFDGLLKNEDQVTYRDLHPLHVFRIRFDLIYEIQNC